MFDGLIPAGPRSTLPQRLELDPADPINRGLLAWWPLAHSGGTTARDLSPRRRHGTLTGFTASGWAVGRYGRALTFDGVDDHIPLGGRWLNNLPRGSFCVRIRPNAGGGMAYYEDGGGFNNFAFNVPTIGSSALTVNIGSNTARQSTTRPWVATTWYDVVVTWGDDIRIYIDGILDTIIAVSGGTANGAGDNDQVGRYSYGGGNVGQYTPASLSHIRIFGRTLTYSEAQRRRIDLWAGTIDPAARLFFAVKAAGGAIYTDSLTESLTASEALTVALSAVTTRADAGTVAEAPSVLLTGAATLADSLAGAEAGAATLTGAATLSDAATVAESPSAALTATDSRADSVTASESLAAAAVVVAALSEALTGADSYTAALLASTSLTDAAVLADAMAVASYLVLPVPASRTVVLPVRAWAATLAARDRTLILSRRNRTATLPPERS